MKKTKSKNCVTPKGVFVYPWLTKPDTEYNADGEYKMRLRLSAAEAEPLIQQVEDALAAKVKEITEEKGKAPKLANTPYAVDEETGEVLFSFKMKASGKNKETGEVWSRKPLLKSNKKIDGKIQDLPADVQIWSGSVGKVAYTVFPYFVAGTGAGVKLRLQGVQVFELVSGSYDGGFDVDDCEEYTADDTGDDSASGFDSDAGDCSEGGASGADF